MGAELIAALATPPEGGALGILRLSGAGCREACRLFLSAFPGQPRRVTRATAHERGRPLDEVLVTYFAAPESYTGEDCVEITAHGSPFILSSLLRLALASGARPASPGEFTLRAFLNGRMDLAQAEAVGALIAARTESAHRAALDHLQGGLSRRIQELRGCLLRLLAHVEASIDHPEEEIPELSESRLSEQIAELRRGLGRLLESHRFGRLAVEGARVAIVGRPNVGKSSLLNALLGRERAIVAEEPGTTRDTLEEPADLLGLRTLLIDTAGIREKPPDPVEAEGMRRARLALERSDMALIVLDRSRPVTAEDWDLVGSALGEGGKRPAIVALNKSDLPARVSPAQLLGDWACRRSGERPPSLVEVSALSGAGIRSLAERLSAVLSGGGSEPESSVVTSLRHYNSLKEADEALFRAAESLRNPELAAVPLREALGLLGSILGENVDADVLAEIFSRFCVGK